MPESFRVSVATELGNWQQKVSLAHALNHHNNHIKVDQQINQLNQCTAVPLDNIRTLDNTASSTVCLNQGDNSVDIVR
jgi:hypothetical protein